MLTSPDNPYVVLPLLHSRGTALQGILSGYYKLTGDQVSLSKSNLFTQSRNLFTVALSIASYSVNNQVLLR